MRALCLLACCLVSVLPAAAGERVRLGVLAYRGAEHTMEEWAFTVRAIQAALPDAEITVASFDHDGLSRALGAREVDFVLTNPGHYVDLEVAHGVSRIATVESNAPVASTVIARADRADLERLSDLKGKRLAIVGTTAFGGFQVAWRELAALGIDPARDLTLVSKGLPMTRVIDAVLGSEVDAGVVRGCLIEQRQAEGALAPGALRVLSQMPQGPAACRISSRIYPDWPFAKARHTPAALSKKVATALLSSEPPPGVAGWTVPVDYQPVHDLFRELMIGPYAALRQVSLLDLVRRHWPWAAMAGIALLVWITHVLRVEGLVRRRTAELAVANAGLRREMDARREAEERDALHRRELDHVGRLSIVGEMASGLAHELNQPLAAIANYAEGCRHRLVNAPVDQKALLEATDRIRQQAARAGQVIQRMRAFAKKREPERTRLDVGEVVAETLELFEGAARRAGVSVSHATRGTPPPVTGDRVQLQQVLLNLLQNALDATRSARQADKAVEVIVEARDGGVAVAVADNGCGIDAEARQRLFEPFFTTKPDGLGLGLALCRTIVEQWGGRLAPDADAAGRTVMRLWLPAEREDASPDA